MAAPTRSITVIFARESDTKNKVRFEEVDNAENRKAVVKDKATVEKLYVSKKKIKDLGEPETLEVVINAR